MTKERAAAFIGEEALAFVEEAAVLEGIGDFLEAVAERDAAAAEAGDVHGDVGDEGEDDPVRDAERAAFGLHLDELLGIGEIAVQVEEEVGTEVVVAVDEHVS